MDDERTITKTVGVSLTLGKGLKNVLNGRVKLAMRACASNTQTWASFGLTALCVPSFGPTRSLRQNQPQPKKSPNRRRREAARRHRRFFFVALRARTRLALGY